MIDMNENELQIETSRMYVLNISLISQFKCQKKKKVVIVVRQVNTITTVERSFE